MTVLVPVPEATSVLGLGLGLVIRARSPGVTHA